ncbi:MAG: hypothetical protein LC126_25220 [Bryobacterales bacterium]|nr:hypothetical protein [Bryobacterales bacterium]
MCDEQAGGTLRVQVALENPPGATRLGLSLNGAWPTFESRQTRDMLFPAGPYTRFAAPVTAWEFKFDSSVIRQGWNFVTVLNNNRNPAGAVKVVSVELGVSFA